MPSNIYSIVCVHRGEYVERIVQYDSDEEDVYTTPRVLWPDRGDGKSFVSHEDYPDDDDEEDSLIQVREETLRLGREACRGTYSDDQDAEDDVVYFDDEDESDKENVDPLIEAANEAAHPDDEDEERQGLVFDQADSVDQADSGYYYTIEDAENYGSEYDGALTPKRRSPTTPDEPPEISRGYYAESAVALCRLPPSVGPQSASTTPHTPPPRRALFSHHLMAELENDFSEYYSEDDFEDNDADDDEEESEDPCMLRWPLSDSWLHTRKQPMVPRGSQSCSQLEGRSSPFLAAPRETGTLASSTVGDMPLLPERYSAHMSPSIRGASVAPPSMEPGIGAGYQPHEFVADFGASILAACPLGPLNVQYEEEDGVSSPLRASLHPRKHARSLDLGEEEDERGAKLRRLSSMPQVLDFGASILAARPLGSLPVQYEEEGDVSSPLRASVNPRKHARSSDPGEEECERDTKLRRSLSMPQVLDFGASILAARPLGTLPLQYEERDDAPSPLRAFDNSRKHPRSSDLGDEECEPDPKHHRPSSMLHVLETPQVGPATEEAGEGQATFIFGGSPTFDFSFMPSTAPGPPPLTAPAGPAAEEANEVQADFIFGKNPSFEFSFMPSTTQGPPYLTTPAGPEAEKAGEVQADFIFGKNPSFEFNFAPPTVPGPSSTAPASLEGDSVQAHTSGTPPSLEPTEDVGTPVQASPPGTPPLPAATEDPSTPAQEQPPPGTPQPEPTEDVGIPA